MGRGIPVSVGSNHFPTKGALTEFVQTLISGYGVGTYVRGDDLQFCLELFKFHPEASLKFGSGIVNVEVRLDDYGHRHFQVHRNDGTDDDISWVNCIRSAR
jgi:hypothetical protein